MKCPFQFAWEKITPALAADWLAKHNTHNRPLRETTVDAYARDMKTNRWSPNHQGIAFSATGALLDGQHRLSAVVASGVTIYALVFRGIPERVEGVAAKVMETVDRGNTRSLADLLKLDYGISESPGTVAAALLHLGRLCVDHPQHQATRATMPQTVVVLEQFGPALNWIMAIRPRTIALRSMLVWASIGFAYAARPREVQAFAERFITGAGLSADSAALTLRNATFSGELEINGTLGRWQSGSRVLASLLADIEGRPLRKLPSIEESVLALKQWRQYQAERVATVAAAFPLLREIDDKRTTLKTRAVSRALQSEPATPVVPPKITKASDLKPTAAAARLLAKAR